MRIVGKKSKTAAMDLAERVFRGDLLAVSRALSLVTEEGLGFEELSRALFAHKSRSHKIGLCGPPGSGKSTLVDRVLTRLREAQERVGVLAVDPTSPLSGGAFLGDRLRVQGHATDPGVFIRSLASRGMLGGLSSTIFGAVHVLEAYGCDRILIETVGAGQGEVDIAQVADTVLCITAPHQGDEFQAMKAGSMEIADILVVNKADLPEVGKAVAYLKEALALDIQPKAWTIPVVAVSASTGVGLEELCLKIDEHRGFLKSTSQGEERLKRQLHRELSLCITKQLYQDAVNQISDRHIEMLLKKQVDPLTLGRRLTRRGSQKSAN